MHIAACCRQRGLRTVSCVFLREGPGEESVKLDLYFQELKVRIRSWKCPDKMGVKLVVELRSDSPFNYFCLPVRSNVRHVVNVEDLR